MRVLIACECSGIIRTAFQKLGHDAWSCDLNASDDMSKQHIVGDCLPVISRGWDLVIAHPPCTHIANSGAKHYASKIKSGVQQQGIDFFMAVVNACIGHAARWCIENPVGIMNWIFRKPDQIIQPYWFGDPYKKTTCLWLSGLPKLKPTDIVTEGDFHFTKSGKVIPLWYHEIPAGPSRGALRSVTFQGIADAMASQWGGTRL